MIGRVGDLSRISIGIKSDFGEKGIWRTSCVSRLPWSRDAA